MLLPLSLPFALVLGACLVAALAAALGPVFLRDGPGTRNLRVGFAYGLASGLMLGAGHILMLEGLAKGSGWVVAGAVVGVLFIFLVRKSAGLEVESVEQDGQDPLPPARRLLLQQSLHSCSEGVAIGVLFLVSFELGLLVAAALTLHNIAEALVLAEALEGEGIKLRLSSFLAVLSNVGQVAFAVIVFWSGQYWGGDLSVLLGFASGVMIYLVLTELLPAGYRRAARPFVATLVTFSAWCVLFIEAILL